MGTWTDYIDDPNAPRATSVVPSVVAIVKDNAGRVLLIQEPDSDRWSLPGGTHRVGESISEAVMRAVEEETGYTVQLTRITGTYTNPRHVMANPDGEVRQQFSIAFAARLLGGNARTSSESQRVEWVMPGAADDLEMHPSMRLRLKHALSGDNPHIG